MAPQLRSSHADGQTLSSARIEPFVTAATSVIDSILSHERPGKGTAPVWLGRPLLVVMSDNPKTARVVSHDPQTRAFDVIGTEEATWTRKFAKRQAGESAAVAQESKEDESALGPNGFVSYSSGLEIRADETRSTSTRSTSCRSSAGSHSRRRSCETSPFSRATPTACFSRARRT